MGSKRARGATVDRVPRGIHWNSKEGKAIVSRIRLGGRVAIPFAGNRKHFQTVPPQTSTPPGIEVWFRNTGSELVHRYQSNAVYSECGTQGFFTGTKPLSELFRMQDEGRKPKYKFCAECAKWDEQW